MGSLSREPTFPSISKLSEPPKLYVGSFPQWMRKSLQTRSTLLSRSLASLIRCLFLRTPRTRFTCTGAAKTSEGIHEEFHEQTGRRKCATDRLGIFLHGTEIPLSHCSAQQTTTHTPSIGICVSHRNPNQFSQCKSMKQAHCQRLANSEHCVLGGIVFHPFSL